MTIKVRSSEGEQLSNDSTPDINSPSSITEGDLLVIFWCFNDDVDAASGLTPPTDFALAAEIFDAAVGDRGMRYAVWTKTATATDATNQGTANYYAFSGMGGVTDILYGIFSLYDDAAGTITYQASSLADNHQTGAGGASSVAPTQTVGYDGSIVLCGWAGRQGTDYFNVGSSVTYAPTGGANPATYHDTSGWTSSTQSDLEWVTGTAEFDVSDSPIGTQTQGHTSCAADVDFYSASMIFEVVVAVTNEGTQIRQGLFT